MLDWLGAKDAESITEDQHEKWARGWEQYLRDGKAPSAALARAFEAFKAWLKAIYRTLRGLGKEIPDSIRAVMDRLVATDDEIAAQRASTTRTEIPARPVEPEKGAFPVTAEEEEDPFSEIGRATSDRRWQYVNDIVTKAMAQENPRLVLEKGTDKLVFSKGTTEAPYRVTSFDKDGPSGHRDYSGTERTGIFSPDQEIYGALYRGFKIEPKSLAKLEAPTPAAAAPAPAAAPTIEEAQAAWQTALEPVRVAARRAWAEAEQGGARKQAQAKFQNAFEGHFTGGEAPKEKWATAGTEAAKVFAKTKEGKAAVALVKKAQKIEAAHTAAEAQKSIPAKIVENAIAAAKASPDPLDQQIGEFIEREVAPVVNEAFPPAAEPTPSAPESTPAAAESTPAVPPPVPDSALAHAKDLAGRVAYHNGDLALIQGFSNMTGKRVYVGAKGDMRANYDIETDKTKLFTPKERAELVEAKRAAVAADEAAHAANPDGPFAGGKTFAASPSVPPELAAFTEGLLKQVGIKARVYLTTVEDARATEFNGPFAAIGSSGVDNNTFGTTRRLPNGDHYIAVSVRPSEQLNLETVSHEVGHIVKKEHWKDAPEEVKVAIMRDYQTWLEAARKPGVTARELMRSTRTPETAESITLPDENMAASDLHRFSTYWTDFEEFFADQTARWALSAKKPMSLVDKFFAAIGAALRKIHEALGNAFKPVKSMKDWLDSLGPAELEERVAPAAEAGPEGSQQILMPGVNPVRDAERARLGAAAPLRGGNAAPPAGGLFDDAARAQPDLLDMTPTDSGLKSSAQIAEEVMSRSAVAGEGGDAQASQASAGRNYEAYIRDLVAQSKITPEDAEAILERYRDNLMRMAPKRAATEAERVRLIAEAEKARRDMLGEKAKKQLIKDVMSYRTPHGAKDMIEAMYSLWEGFGHAGYPGVKQLHEAYLGLMHAKMADVLNAYSRTFVSGARRQTVSMDELRKASFGEKADPKAVALYRSFADTAEWARQKRNELGGMTPKREDWGLPQSHDEAAVARAFGGKTPNEARANWVKYINERLDWSKMYDTTTGELFEKPGHNGGPPLELLPERKQAILGHVWDTIVTGGEINMRPSLALRGRGSIATQRADHRFLVFKDAKSASEYNREFGTGDEFTQMMEHLHSMAADLAIMHRFGPNPAGMVEFMKQMLTEQRAKAEVGQPHQLRKIDHNNAKNKVDHANDILDGFFEQYRGDRPERNKLALAGTIMRNVVTSALLGSSAIPHATSNWLIQSFARYAGGIPAARVIPQLLRAFAHSSHEEMLRAGLDVENGLFNVGSGARQLGKMQKIANWSRWLPDRTTHWFGLTPIVEANKGAFFRGMMAHLADMQKIDWRDLPERIRSKLEGYGLRERDWRVIQTAKLHTPAVGSAPWLRPPEVMDAGGATDAARHEQILQAYGRTSLDPTRDAQEAAKIAEDVGLKMLTYMHGEREIAVPANSMRARARIYGNSDAGKWWGQFRRSFGLFKGFIGSFMVSQIHTIVAEAARGLAKGARYAAAVFIGMTLGGMVSLQLKQARSGKDFLPMNPLTSSGFVTWLRAILTGGSFGIFGDFLASERSSFGVGPLETLAGPVAGILVSLFSGSLEEIKNRYAQKKKEPLTVTGANAAVKFLRGNTPFLSTGWPVMAAYNRMLDQVMRMYDPNAIHRQRLEEEHLRNDTGQHFTWRPGQIAPDRLPRLTPSR